MTNEDLKSNISYSEKNTENHRELSILDIAKNELNFREKVKQKQIDILTKSLTSSSRRKRWITSIKSFIKNF
tara:strand:- start:57 stop:272 length:216 start_codon:yes stop_codon:yes gene_type:complete